SSSMGPAGRSSVLRGCPMFSGDASGGFSPIIRKGIRGTAAPGPRPTIETMGKLYTSVLLLALALAPSLARIHAAPEATRLDKEFYNDYLDSLPDEKVRRTRTLETNLLRVLKRLVPREDPEQGPEYARTLTEKDFVYQRVTEESAFVRGLFHELPYLKPAPF